MCRVNRAPYIILRLTVFAGLNRVDEVIVEGLGSWLWVSGFRVWVSVFHDMLSPAEIVAVWCSLGSSGFTDP